jgi:hypothetical protein
LFIQALFIHDSFTFRRSTPVHLAIRPRGVVRLCIAAITLLVIADSVGNVLQFVYGHDQVFGLQRLFDLNREANIPTWYSVCQLLVAAFLLAAIARASSATKDGLAPYWWVLAVGFGYLSLDELAQLHEMTDNRTLTPILGAAHNIVGTDARTLAWAAISIPLVLVMLAVFRRFLLRLPSATRWRFIIAGALYVGGVVGMELVSNQYHSHHPTTDLAAAFMSTLEETLEMSGVATFIYALLAHIAATMPGLRVGVDVSSGHTATVARQPVAPREESVR